MKYLKNRDTPQEDEVNYNLFKQPYKIHTENNIQSIHGAVSSTCDFQ